jgi:(2Fe-2S) ferredoxin
MGYFDKHVFFCTNQREDGSDCCNNHGAQHARDYVKNKVKELAISDRQNRIRINSAGCLDRCDEGPVLVVYPEGIWYTFVDESDLDEIIEEHLKYGRIVERLKLPVRSTPAGATSPSDDPSAV